MLISVHCAHVLVLPACNILYIIVMKRWRNILISLPAGLPLERPGDDSQNINTRVLYYYCTMALVMIP